MSVHFFHPLGEYGSTLSTNNYSTYPGHGGGSASNIGYGCIDILTPYNSKYPGHNEEIYGLYSTGHPIYAMTDGVIVANTVHDAGIDWDAHHGKPTVGTTVLSQSCPAICNGLGITFYIRYLHGDYIVNVGDTVRQGQLIGYSHSHGNSTDPHLHVDFVTNDQGGGWGYMGGYIDESSFVYNDKSYKLNKDLLNMSKLTNWKTQTNGEVGNQVGYCWLVFASKLIYNTGNVSTESIEDIISALVSAHYKRYINGEQSYSNDLNDSLKTVINGHNIISRPDCTGLINGIWQALGDVDAESSKDWRIQGPTNYPHPSNWTLHSPYNASDLRVGDVITQQGHVEIIHKIEGDTVWHAAYGTNEYLVKSYKGIYTSNRDFIHSNYPAIIRRNTPYVPAPPRPSTPSGSIEKIQKSYYNNSKGNDNQQAVNAYFTSSFSERFCGAYPSDWSTFQSDACKSIRCVVDFCMHEVGSWPITCAIAAKLLRSNVLSSGYLHCTNAIINSTTMYDWMNNVTHTLWGYIGPWEGPVDGVMIYNSGRGCITPGTGQYLPQTNENLKRVQAIYNNFRYPDIYGFDLQDSFKSKTNYLSSLIKAVSIMPTANGGYWNSNGISMIESAIYNAIVNYDPNTDIDYGKEKRNSYWGRVLLYRQNGNINYYNPNPLKK